MEDARSVRYRREALVRGCVLDRDNEGKDVMRATSKSFVGDQVSDGRVVYSSLKTHVIVSVPEGTTINDAAALPASESTGTDDSTSSQ